MTVMKGTVKFFNQTKGFGFITGEDGNDYFVHSTGLKEGVMLRDEGEAVTFEIEQGDKGPKAVNVAKAGAAESTEDSEEVSE